MHTPDDPVRAKQREALRAISKALIPLHRALIENARLDFVDAGHRVDSPGHLLRLLSEEPFFDWLRPLTSLIVDIDETATRDFDESHLASLVARIDRLFGATQDAEFAAKYLPILHRDFDVATNHGAIRVMLTKLTTKP